jgi:hypothetical protein
VTAGTEIGVWIAARDSAPTLDAALGSIAAQSVQPSEVVFVDDGSSDSTADAAERWSGRLPMHVVRHERPFGIVRASAEAARVSECAWVARMDVTGCWLPDHLATMQRTLHNDEHTLVAARVLSWSPGRGLGPDRRQPTVAPAARSQLHALLERNLLSGSTCFSRSLYDRVGGYRSGLLRGGDWDLGIRMVRSGARLVMADHATVLKRVVPQASPEASDDGDIMVLRYAVQEATDPAERAVAQASGRRLVSAAELRRASDHARNHRTRAARRAALAALSGGGRSAVAASLIVVAPESGIRLLDWRATRRLDRLSL